MKIHQLPQGARFEYEGEEFVKTGPMSGTGKAGQRLIPRYSVLKPLDNVETASTPKINALPRADALRAFDAFYTDCKGMVPEHRQVELDAARDRFLKTIAA
jgi:hypothetical protein